MQAASDPNRTIEYRQDFTYILAFSMGAVVVGLLVLTFTDTWQKIRDVGWVLAALGLLGIAWVLWRMLFAGSLLLRLSPQGIDWYSGTREVRIPWGEVRGIDTASFQVRMAGKRSRFSGRRVSSVEDYRDITMVLVSQEFHDRHVDPGSAFLRGPYWQAFVRRHGDGMAIALHHESYGVTPGEVRMPIETRWLAFRDREAPPAPGDDRFGRGALKFGGASNLVSLRGVAFVGVPLAISLVLAANLLGTWEREAMQHDAWASESAREDSEQAERSLKEGPRNLDDTMKRINERWDTGQ